MMIASVSMPAKCRAYLFKDSQIEPLNDDPTDTTDDVEAGIRDAGYFLVRRVGATERQADDGYGYARIFERLSPHLSWLLDVSPCGDQSELIFADSALDALALIARVERDLAAQQSGKAVRR